MMEKREIFGSRPLFGGTKSFHTPSTAVYVGFYINFVSMTCLIGSISPALTKDDMLVNILKHLFTVHQTVHVNHTLFITMLFVFKIFFRLQILIYTFFFIDPKLNLSKHHLVILNHSVREEKAYDTIYTSWNNDISKLFTFTENFLEYKNIENQCVFKPKQYKTIINLGCLTLLQSEQRLDHTCS